MKLLTESPVWSEYRWAYSRWERLSYEERLSLARRGDFAVMEWIRSTMNPYECMAA